MNTRRKFLLQGTLATAAITIGNSFKSLAGKTSTLSGFSFSSKKIVLLHTSDANTKYLNHAVRQISTVKKTADNMLLIHTGNSDKLLSCGVIHDVAMQHEKSITVFSDAYQIIHRGDIKTGIIKTAFIESDIINSVNTLSKWLKEDKNCQLIVCLSHLGYKNSNTTDDLQLAKKSTHVDIIISGHPLNFKNMPVITHNSNRAEVIIQSASDNGFGLANLEICFDRNNKKCAIDFNNLLKRTAAIS